MAVGMICGAIAGLFIAKFLLGNDSSKNKDTALIFAVLDIFTIFIAYILGIIIHESGHLVMGLLTGYKFVSFRIGTFTIVKRDGKLSVNRFKVVGTAGQCLMTHDIVDSPEDIPYFWYHAGGGLFNILTAVIMGSVSLILKDGSQVKTIVSLIAVVSLFIALLNLIPMKLSGVQNDGANILLQLRSPEERKYLLNGLIIAGNMYQGKTLYELPEKLFDGADAAGDLGKVQLAIDKAGRSADLFDFETARDMYERILENDSLVEILANECRCELMFCYIMLGESKEKIDELYDDVKKYIAQTEKFMLSKTLIMYVYYYIYKKDKTNADKYCSLTDTMSENYVCPGEAKAVKGTLEYIKQNY